jgi:hypothetical protein
MNLDLEYRIGIMLARNGFVIRETQDARLRARVAADSAKLRRQLQGAGA